MAQTFAYATCADWQIWKCSRREATQRASLLAGRDAYVLMRDHAPASEIIAWNDLNKCARISKVIATQKPSYVER